MNNIYIEGLGKFFSKEELYIKLNEIKKGDLDTKKIFEKSDDKFIKFLKLQVAVRRFHVGLDVHYRTFSKLFRLMYNHYSRYDMQKIKQQKQNIFKDTGDNVAIEGFSLYGPSGVGKTSLFSLLQKLFGPYIVHEDFDSDQIPILLVNCTTTGTPKSLCLKIFRAIDKLIDSDYATTYKQHSTEDRIEGLSKILQIHKVGVIVLDEAHNIVTYRSFYKKEIPILLKNLPNETGVPIVFCGDERIFLLHDDDDLQIIRRGTGNGTIEYKPIEFKDKEDKLSIGRAWDTFYSNISNYVFIKNQLLDDKKIKLAYWKYSGGIPGIALILHTAILERLVNSDNFEHPITEDLVKFVAENDLSKITSIIYNPKVEKSSSRSSKAKHGSNENIYKEIFKTKNKKNGYLLSINNGTNSEKDKCNSLKEMNVLVSIKDLYKHASILP